jgi:hypothetical protein
MTRLQRAVFAVITATTVLTISATSYARERRCGWVVNPTPGSWFFKDKDGIWELSSQGRLGVPGFDDMGDVGIEDIPIREDDPESLWRAACACFEMSVDSTQTKVLRIIKATKRPIAACRKDRAIND